MDKYKQPILCRNREKVEMQYTLCKELDTYKARNIGKSTRKYKPFSYRNVSP